MKRDFCKKAAMLYGMIVYTALMNGEYVIGETGGYISIKVFGSDIMVWREDLVELIKLYKDAELSARPLREIVKKLDEIYEEWYA